ncbi:GEM-like protein 4 [Morus notabilis]|uniref:GEM-like protein 4 n=1 Tax=Morus notabilis TaxID=981085 RepID=UPI000CED7F23|nr:GEM-like protein 4 [Morus notabilis]
MDITGIAINSISYPLDKRSPMALLTNTATQYNNNQFAEDGSSALKRRRVDLALNRMNKLGNKADSIAHGENGLLHVGLGAKIAETVKRKLSFGARFLQVGGFEKIFKQLFRVTEGEKLLKASQCYLSTTAGPLAGLLFISSEKIAFCSRKSIKFSSHNGEIIRSRYKVVIPVSKIKRVNQSLNVKKPSQKYIEIVTVDNFDFWFMGFLSYKKSFKYVLQAVSQA